MHPQLEAQLLQRPCSLATLFRCCPLLYAANSYSNTIPEPYIQRAPADVFLSKGGAATAADSIEAMHG